MPPDAVAHLIASRRRLAQLPSPGVGSSPAGKAEAEGGCGVVGVACTVPVVGRHILAPCGQMHNRGNGKGGGLAAAGLVAPQMGVDEATLRGDYLIQVALLDPAVREVVVREYLQPVLDVRTGYPIPTVEDYRDIEGLDVRPPDVWRYFARVKPEVLERFITEQRLTALDRQAVEDEYLAQWAFQLNHSFYGAQRRQAFVLSYGRDMLVLKIVGYAEQVLRYYKMEDVAARIWIGHQRYPTKGRVWHPGGAHPFAALDVALVHNGDFANYHAVCEYLAQRHLSPLFGTDTEVAVLLFDLWARTYGYPLEYLIEAMAPTTERDFLLLSADRQRIYRALQAAHIHGSPDGPWFFIIARTLTGGERGAATAWQLLGITDTSMLRPQVFALQEGEISVGIIASEKQAIDATLASLYHEDARLCPVADRYWNARGGSYTDGGAFAFTVTPDGGLSCTNKFGDPVTTPPGQVHHPLTLRVAPVARAGGAPPHAFRPARAPEPDLSSDAALAAQGWAGLPVWDYDVTDAWLDALRAAARAGDDTRRVVITALTLLIDRRRPTGIKKRSSVLAALHTALYGVLRDVPSLEHGDGRFHRVDWHHRDAVASPPAAQDALVVDADGFPSEGADSLARYLVRTYERGWRLVTVFNLRGQRFVGVGFGPHTDGLRIDAYGSSGDYLASGLDGMEMYVHNDAQDQVGQILKSGTLVVFGSVGQTLLYGAKGGEIYILGHAAGRPLINAVGRPRVIINGTALDYLAESFMAGDPLDDGGFAILNGITFDADGRIVDLDTPYPGGNLFSLASGGALYARDPHRRLDDDQLNGGRYAELTDGDWELIRPYLEKNETLLGIPVTRLLTVDGDLRSPPDVYRKVEPVELAILK